MKPVHYDRLRQMHHQPVKPVVPVLNRTRDGCVIVERDSLLVPAIAPPAGSVKHGHDLAQVTVSLDCS
jgi:hypothetical protein